MPRFKPKNMDELHGNGKKPISAPPPAGCWIVAPIGNLIRPRSRRPLSAPTKIRTASIASGT
jgi:hypothetical protein